MSATHAVGERRLVRPSARARRPDQSAAPEPSNVEVSLHRLDRIVLRPASDGGANELLDAALGEPVQALPHASLLERRFGQPLGWVQVRSGALVQEALDSLGAQAATRGDTIFLRERSAPVDVVAHEVTHTLQGRNAASDSGGGVVAENAPQETEAGAASARTGTLALAALQAPVRPAEGLAPGAIALLRSGPGPAENPVNVVAPAAGTAARSLAPPALASAPLAAAPAAVAPAPAGQATTADGANAVGAAAAAVVTAQTAEPEDALTRPPSQQLTVPSEETAAREAGAALAGAGGAAAVLRAYADAPPTVKAQQAASLSSHLETAIAVESEQWQSAVPGLEAHLSGVEGPPPPALHVETPKAVELELEPEVVPPAPEPEIPAAPEPPSFTANDQVSGAFSRLTDPPPEQLAEAIGNSLSEVRTSDPLVPRSPGPPPAIPLGGETDPARIQGQEAAGKALASGTRDDAARAILDGPGPEQVQPVTVREAYAIEAVESPSLAPLDAPAGPAVYLALNLPPDVQTAFDEQQQAAMQEGMVAATAKAEEVTVARDTARDEAVATAQVGAAELNSTAQRDQDGAVASARTTIQAQRQASIDAQQTEVSRIEKDVADRRRLDEGKIGTQVQAGQKAIDDSYVQGEKDITGQVAEGERMAQAEREQAQREAENEGWWDRTVSFVRDAFNALIVAIGAILDAVRKAVNRALDALTAFALSVIDRVASFVKDAIGAFGAFLKFAVNTLIGTFFPRLASKLNAAIDKAVAAAQSAVDVVAEGLRASVQALVEGLRAGVNAAIKAFQAGIGIAISFVSAALTGDWGMLAKKVLAAVLRLVGVNPEAFYAFVGRAQETFEIIINDPLAFLSRLVSAVVGGVQRFADRFSDHLKKGVVGWLTGTLGGPGITLPRTFDLMGVLDLSRQIVGLTWERIRAKAVKLVGERNVARLEFIGSYITTLIDRGWSGLWNKIGADVGGLLDMVFDGIKSFLLERVVLAIIKKIPALFGPVGAIVQLVMTAWNLYEFLRDQLSRIAALVRTVVDRIGDIARGILTAASEKVEEALGSLVPIALDLLARVLGLGDVGQDVRKIVGKVQAFIEKAIDGLITRVIGLFTGKGKGGTTAPEAAGTAAGGGVDVTGAAAVQPADPQVKATALMAAHQRITEHKSESIEALHDAVAAVYREFQPRGLRALWFDVTSEATLQGRLLASASEPEQRVIGWKDIFDPLDPEKLLFESQPRNETHATISVAGHRVGSVQASDKDHHAEENLVAAHWDEALALAVSSATPSKKPTLAVAINRAPCHKRCAPLLAELLRKLDPAVKVQISFVLAPTGVYEPTEALTPESIEAQRKELTDVAAKIGRPASALIREQLNKVVFTEDTTTMGDLRNLVAVGWDLRQLQARAKQTVAGQILAQAAHNIAFEAEQKVKAGAK